MEGRHIKIELRKLEITGFCDDALDSGCALDVGVFPVRVTAGVDIGGICNQSITNGQFILFKQFLYSRFYLFRFADCLHRLPADGGKRIDLALSASVLGGGNGNSVAFTQALHILFQCVCGNAAHIHVACTGDGACGQMQIQLFGCCFCIFAVHLKEIAHLIQNNIIPMVMLDVVVVQKSRGRRNGFRHLFIGFFRNYACFFLCLCCLFRFILFKSFRGEVPSFADQLVNALGNLIPVQLYIGAIPLVVAQTFTIVIFMASRCMGKGVGMTADAILLFQEVRLLLGRVGFPEEVIDTAFPTGKAAPTGQGCVDFVLGDKLLRFGQLCHSGGKLTARQGQVFQTVPDFFCLMEVEPHQAPILAVCCPKGSIFIGEGLSESGVFEGFGQSCGSFGITTPAVFLQTGQIPLLPCFLAEISAQMPKGACNQVALMSMGFLQFHIGGILSVLQKLTDTLGGVLP